VSDKWESYLLIYDEIFNSYKTDPINLLEIGIQNGGSLEIWAKYFSEFNKLVGCDINPKCSKLIYDDSRISVIVGDANKEEVQEKILHHAKNYQIIIDDGSHTSRDIISSFARYFKYIEDGGLYVIEDLHCSYWEDFGGGVYDPYSSIAFLKILVDVINHEHFGNDLSLEKLLLGFESKFNITFDSNELRKIGSIKFYNSICVIEKKSYAKKTGVGKRVVCGNEELVVEGHKKLNETSNITPQQKNNFWSNLEVSPSEAFIKNSQEIKRLSELNKELFNEIDVIKNSFSWKITSPLRFIMSKIYGKIN
jgi:23S rRNA U2552 (ribose-2'-O)-methylase RlmE/FtsJ